MITVFESIKEWCEQNQKQFTKSDLADLGAIISKNFKKEWCSTIIPNNIIDDTGFKKEIQESGTYISNGYPDTYKPTMIGIIKVFYENKALKRKRKRIPAGSSKQFRNKS
jgi:hypothetical protein